MSGHYSERGWVPGTPNTRALNLPSEVQSAVDKVLNCSRSGKAVYLNPAETCYVALVLAPMVRLDPKAALSLSSIRKINAEVSGD